MKQELDITLFDENLVNFDVFKIKNSHTLWLNSIFSLDFNELFSKQYNEENFREEFSFASAHHGLLPIDHLMLNEKRIFQAERYGGIGVGQNGGGARTGNAFRYQIKGVGSNPLAGNSTNDWYTYGGLNISDAICEVILGSVLDSVLPRRTVRNLGLIATHSEGAYYYFKNPIPKKSWGALLVREQCLRPAHFFRAPDFKVKPEFNNCLMRDSIRIKRVLKNLKYFLGNDDKKFIELIFDFLAASAEQFSFSKCFRITHGSPSSSNLDITGKWVDLTNSSFLDGGKNYGINNPFFDEHLVPGQIAYDLCYVYSKVNHTKIDYSIIKSHYKKLFSTNFERFALQVLGLGELPLNALNSDKKNVVNYFFQVIYGEKRIITEWPEGISTSDPVTNFIAWLYSYISGVYLPAVEGTHSIKKIIPNEIGESFLRLYRLAGLSKTNILCGALRSLKWAYYSAFYYRGRIVNAIEDQLNTGSLDDISNFIYAANEFHLWALNLKEKDSVTLYKSAAGTIYYDSTAGRYFISNFACCADYSVSQFEKVVVAAKAIKSTDFKICNFSILNCLLLLEKVIAPMENSLSE